MAYSSTHVLSCARGRVHLAATSDKARAAKYVSAFAIVTALGGVLCLFIASAGSIPPWTAYSLGNAGSIIGVMAMTVALVSSAVFVYTKKFSVVPPVSHSPSPSLATFSPNYRLSGSTIYIDVVKQDVETNPHTHLDRLALLAAQNMRRNRSLSVQFFTAEGVAGVGVDGGALRREYIGLLFNGLREHSELSWDQKSSKLFVPRAKWTEREVFRKMGQVMLYCFGRVPLGSHFDLSVFEVVLSLTGEEIRTSFSALSPQTKLKMYAPLCGEIDQKKRMVELAKKDSWGTAELAEAKSLAQILGLSADNQQSMKVEFLSCLSEDYDAQLLALHALAGGLRSLIGSDSVWNAFCTQKATTLYLRAQGSANAEHIASSLVYRGHSVEVRKKVRWLQEWLRDSSRTTTELQEFLVDFTGASALPVRFTIQVEDQSGSFSPCPMVHVCGNPSRRIQSTIEISPAPCRYGEFNDVNKENFIRSLILIRAARKQDTGYTDI